MRYVDRKPKESIRLFKKPGTGRPSSDRSGNLQSDRPEIHVQRPRAPEDTGTRGIYQPRRRPQPRHPSCGEQPTVQVPVVGRVAAGQPILAVEEVEGYVPFCPPNQNADDYFALRVRGESMKCAGILDGDLVIARKVSTAEDGEMVVALIEDEATVKYLYREPDRIRLQPDNPEYEPIYATDVTVIGKVVASIRYYK